MTDQANRKRAGGRAGHRLRAGTRAIDQMPWRIPQNHDRPTEPTPPEGVETNVPDGQAMWETSNSLWASVQSGTHMVYHAAGWLEGGLIASPEKFIMDCEVLQMIQRYMEPQIWATSPDDIAVEVMAEVGPDGHCFGCQHTQDRYTSAFCAPIAGDWRNYEAWQQDGGLWTPERAHKIFKAILAEYEPPPLDEAIHEELRDFVAQRKAEGGAPTDF